MASTADHIAARGDQDLMARMIAAAEQQGIPSAAGWVQQNMGSLIGVEVQDGQTITDVYAYAAAVRKDHMALDKALPPGKNPGAVTDQHLARAITELITPGK